MLSPPLMFNYVTNSAELDVLPPIEGFHGDTGMMRWNYAFFMFDSCKHQDVASQFMNWWLVNSKPLHEKGGVTSIPIRKSFWDTKLLRDSRSRFVLDEWLPIGKIITAPCPHLLPTTGKLEGPSFMPVFMQDLLNLEPVDASLQKVHDAMAELEA
jgi:multiple sugar transport system substrate-binding protein